MNGFMVVDTNKLNAAANELMAKAAQLASLAEDLANKANQLAQWEGDASNAYVRKLYAERQDVVDCMNMVRKRSRELMELARNYNKAERENTGDANALRTDVVRP